MKAALACIMKSEIIVNFRQRCVTFRGIPALGALGITLYILSQEHLIVALRAIVARFA